MYSMTASALLCRVCTYCYEYGVTQITKGLVSNASFKKALIPAIKSSKLSDFLIKVIGLIMWQKKRLCILSNTTLLFKTVGCKTMEK